MKKNILIGTFILSLFVASCNKENIPDNISIRGERITVSANISKDTQTKLSYIDDTTSKTFKMSWSAKESFIVYCGESKDGKVFTKGNGNNFSGEKPLGTGKYYAVYGCADTSNTNGVLTVDIANQKGDTTENGIISFMVAESEELDNTTKFDFNHKLAILKLNLKLPLTDTTVDKVIISGMHNKVSYTLSDSSYAYNNKGEIVATNDTSGFKVKDSVITAYISVFPETVAAKSVTIIASVGNDKYAYTMTNGKTLKAGIVIPVNVKLVRMFQQSDYYQWDAYASCDYPDTGWQENSSGYNKIKEGSATQSCKYAPTKEQMEMYLGAGVYWVEDGTAYKLSDGQTYCCGLMVKKKDYIDGFATNSATKKRRVTPNTDFSSLSSTEQAQYFFLPACGYYFDSKFYNPGSFGGYWLSTPNPSNTDNAYYFTFYKGTAITCVVSNDDRSNCYLPMPCL